MLVERAAFNQAQVVFHYMRQFYNQLGILHNARNMTLVAPIASERIFPFN